MFVKFCFIILPLFSLVVIYVPFNNINCTYFICIAYKKELYYITTKMKCTIPEISWHNKEPVLSVDIQQVEHDAKFYRLASGGSDNHVLIWQLKIQNNGAAAIELLADLTRHQRSVNVVRWSPNGQYLASADDDANIIIWTLKMDNIPSLDGEDENKESWIVHKVLRGHKEDIYDMCWSPDGSKLLTGSIDNTAIVWDVSKGKNEHIITDHKSFVQGVAWNPTHQPPYMATLSSDRTCRILDATSSRYQIRYRIARGMLPLPTTHPLSQACASTGADGGESVVNGVKLFHDDTFKTYFRRLAFSPDGTLLLVPSGYVEMNGGDGVKGDGDGKAVQERKVLYGTYLFKTMGSFSSPSAVLVSPRQCTIAVRCCPLLFELRPNGPDPYIQLPYRMVFAIATDSDVVLYDTQQTPPFAHLQNIHYTRLTDLTWSPDGRILTAASTDGFCTIVTFEADELGKVYVKEESEIEDCALNISGEVLETTMEVEQENIVNLPISVEKEVKKKKPSFLEQWTKASKKSPKTDDRIGDQSCSAKKEFITEKQSTSSKATSKFVGRARTVLFVSESDEKEGNALKDQKEETIDCEFIDLSSSLSNDGEKQRKRITPILLSNVRKDTTSATNMKSPSKITPSIIPTKTYAANLPSKIIDASKRRITPTLISKKDDAVKDSKVSLSKDVQQCSFDSEIINLVTNKFNNSVENSSIKRRLPPSDTIISKSPPSAKKFKTNTLLNFIQRGPKKSSTINPNPTQSNKTTFITSAPTKMFSDTTLIEHKVISGPLTSILTEESARDAWNCEQIQETILDLTEDIPEDFKLQVEESTNTNIENPKMQQSSEQKANEDCEDGVLLINDVVEDTSSAVTIFKDNITEINETSSKVSATEVSENKYSHADVSDINSDKIEQQNNDEIKVEDKTLNIVRSEGIVPVKRRVPLITLSSPKNKKKPSTES